MKLEQLKKIPKVYINSGLPIKFFDYDLEDFKILGESKQERDFNKKSFQKFCEYYENLEENILEGKGLILCGAKGIGKTMLTTILAKKAVQIYMSWNRELKAEYGDDRHVNKLQFIQATSLIQLAFRSTCSPKELELAYELKTFSGLCIDDITKIQSMKDQKEFSILDDLFRYRDLNKLVTWLTCQMDLQGLAKTVPAPLFDIIQANCMEIVFMGESQRGSKDNG